MPQRPSSDWPRLSGRPGEQARAGNQPSQTVFRRFFDLIERLERPRAAPASKAQPPVRGKARR